MSARTRGRRQFSAAKEYSPSDSWDKKIERAKYGIIARHVIFLAGAAQWVAKAGADAHIQHPSALKEYEYRAAKLGKWAAAWLKHPEGPKVFAQACAVSDFAIAHHIEIREVFTPETMGEPIFGNTEKLRADLAKKEGNVAPSMLEIPTAIPMVPVDEVAYEILWRSLLTCKVDPAHRFDLAEIRSWFPDQEPHPRTIQKAVAKLGIPMRSQGHIGRPRGSRDSPDAHRQMIKGLLPR